MNKKTESVSNFIGSMGMQLVPGPLDGNQLGVCLSCLHALSQADLPARLYQCQSLILMFMGASQWLDHSLILFQRGWIAPKGKVCCVRLRERNLFARP